MCGITGWVDFDRDLSGEKEVLSGMVQTLVRRGPDAEGCQFFKHAVLGHRRLCVVDPVGGGQPMLFKRGGQEFCLVYNGELYNTGEIRDILLAKGYRFQGHSDTEVLLKAYVEWREDCLERLNGIFAFAVWDEGGRNLFLARDRLGVKPLFYATRGSSFIFGSELKTLLAHPLVEPVIDGGGLAEIFLMGPSRTPGHGVFKDIFELKPGHCLAVAQKRVRRRRYWTLQSKPHEDDLKSTALKVKQLLQDSLQRQLVSDVPVAAFLSGGLDSTILTAYAAKNFNARGGKLLTFSVDYLDQERYFKENAFQPHRDAPWASRVSEKLGTAHHRIILDIDDLILSLPEATYARDLPGMADVDSSLYLFCRVVKKEVTVAISGECADEIFGGYPWFSLTENGGSGVFPWIRSIPRRMSLLSPEVVAVVQPETYLRERYREALAEVPRLPGEEIVEARAREMFYLNISRFMPTLLDRKDRMSMAVGLEARVPFCDHRLVEYAWNIPWSMKNHGGMEKGILRLAMEGEIPPEVLRRKKSPYPVTHHPAFFRATRKALLDALQQPDSPLKELVNEKAVREFARFTADSDILPWFGQLMRAPQLLAYLYQVDLWMRRYKVRVQ